MGRLADEAREMARIADWLSRDEDDGPIDSDGDGEKALARRGWQCKGGILECPTSDGRGVGMWPYDAIFGSRGRGTFRTKALVTLNPGYKAALGRYLTLAAASFDPHLAMARLEGSEQKTLSEGSDLAGGYLVPAETAAEIRAREIAYSVIWPYATIVPCASDYVRIAMAEAPASPDDSTYESGFVGDWIGEIPSSSSNAVDPVFGQLTISLKKARARTKLANDLVSDSAIDIFAWLARSGGRNLALVNDRAFLSGDGSLKPVGIVSTPGIVAIDVSGTTASTISNTTAAPGSAPKLKTLCYALPSQYAARARWIALRATEANIRRLVDNQNRFLYPEDDDAETPGLLGRPIDNSPGMPADGVVGSKCLLFGDLGEYVIAHNGMTSVRVLRELFAETDQLGFILFDRVGGALSNTDAVRLGTE